MALTTEDLAAIEQLITKALAPIKADLNEMKKDLSLLATINQLEEIKKDGRLRSLYVQKPHEQEEA